MPIYEYVCKACGKETEVMQKISEKALKKCPSCNALKLQRLISKTSFQLKGDGWYVTGGYGGKSKDKAKAKPDSASGKSDKPDKPAKKSEKKAAA